MPKLKTKSSCKGRFKITGTGKVMFKRVGNSHFMSRKSRNQTRPKHKEVELSSSSSKFVLKKFISYFKKLRKIL